MLWNCWFGDSSKFVQDKTAGVDELVVISQGAAASQLHQYMSCWVPERMPESAGLREPGQDPRGSG